MNRLLLLGILPLLFACVGGSTNNKSQAQTKAVGPNDVVVLYFHGKQRCVTCNAIERLTKEVVDSLANEQIAMQVIDLSKSENEALADQYQVTWSALIVERGDHVENLTEAGFGYAKNQPQVFKAKLVEAIGNIAK